LARPGSSGHNLAISLVLERMEPVQPDRLAGVGQEQEN